MGPDPVEFTPWSGRRLVPRLIVFSALLGALGAVLWVFGLHTNVFSALVWIESAGLLGVLVFFLLYVLGSVFLVPGSILSMGAGVLFGVVQGTLIASVSSAAGAAAAFLVGRYLARDWVARRIQGNATFQAIDEAVAVEGWKIVLLARLSPAFPYVLLNYAFGLTRVPLGRYTLATWVGMIPGTAMLVYIGSLVGNLAELRFGHGGAAHSPVDWAYYTLGLIATLAVAFFVARLARRALSHRVKTLGMGEDDDG